MIQNPELLKLVKYKLGVFDLNKDINEEDLPKIRDLSIRDKSLSGKPLNIDLSEITELSGLEALDIQLFTLGEKEAEAIGKLKELKRLTIRDSSINESIKADSLDTLTIERGRVAEGVSLPEARSVNLIELEDVNLSMLSNPNEKLGVLLIRGGNISNLDRLNSIDSLKSLTIEATKADRSILSKLALKNVFINYNEDRSRLYTSKIY